MGPFRCAICNQDFENTEHLFLNCNFTKQVMHIVYSELIQQISWPKNCITLIGKWSKAYKGSFSKKSNFHRTWKASIKFVCWKISLARNKLIFKDKLTFPSTVVSHVMGQMGDYLTSQRFKVMAENHLEKEEEKWMKKINLTSIHSLKSPQKLCW